MNKRFSRVSKAGKGSLVVVLPKDWVRGMKIQPGSTVEVVYNGVVTVKPVKNKHGGEPER